MRKNIVTFEERVENISIQLVIVFGVENSSLDLCNMISKSVKTEETVSDLRKELSPNQYKWNITWIRAFILVFLHTVAVYGLLCLHLLKYWTILWAFIVGTASILGITAGSHRLWSHRTYKAKWQLRLLLMILSTVAFQGTIYDWARNHRVHHKFTDTDADPYNARRGFFFSHIGWLFIRKHPDVIQTGATINYSDLTEDPIVVFQRKYYFYLVLALCFIFPTLVPWLAWNESLWYSWIASVTRHSISFQITCSVNSFAHMWGMKPYDKTITPVENVVISVLTLGEGWHNYHHVFPWDYKTSEFGSYETNITTAFIDFFAFIGWVYDRKTASKEIVKKRVLKNNEENVNNNIRASPSNRYQMFQI